MVKCFRSRYWIGGTTSIPEWVTGKIIDQGVKEKKKAVKDCSTIKPSKISLSSWSVFSENPLTLRFYDLSNKNYSTCTISPLYIKSVRFPHKDSKSSTVVHINAL